MTRAATTALLNKCIKHQYLFIKPSLLKSHSQRTFFTSSSNPFTTVKTPYQVRRESDKADNGGGGFDEMVSGTHRRYYMLGGKGGVGKTSCAASLAVKFASHGHPTMVVSTDPAHSLSDSFAQDLSGGGLVPIQGVDTPLFAIEINAEKSREALSEGHRGTEVRDVMSGMGLGMLADKFGDLKMEELFDTLPPGLDEVIAIHKVMEFAESQQYNMFTRIVFDTAPTGHTLRLLSLPDFMDGSIGKMMRLKKKLSSATSAIKSVFGRKEIPQNSSESDNKLEQIKEKMGKVRDLFHNTDTTEFIIVTIPTVMAISESSRLGASLRKENVPVRRLVVNQVIPQSASGCKFCSLRHKDQKRSMEMIQNDAELGRLRRIEAPMVDAEIRGVPALKFMGDLVWR